MKKLIIPVLSVAFLVGCDTLNQVAGDVLTSGGGTTAPALTNAEVISGLKSALQVAIKNSSSSASATDGFNGNSIIRLPFPPEAQEAKDYLLDKGLLKPQIEKFELTLNRAAEEAAKEAAPIFIDAITNMSIQDGFKILNGADDAATQFLKVNTTDKLVAAFSPKAKEAIDKVELTKYWEPVINGYNKTTFLTGKEKVNANLEQYVTDRAISGLFTLMEDEEKKIRKNPAARVNDILKKVFGSLDS